MILILFIFFFSFSFSEILDHQIPKAVYYKSPLEIKVYTDYTLDQISQINIFYRSNSSSIFMKGPLNQVLNDYYSYTIPAEFINDKYIEYYILLETNDGEYQSIPSNDPYDVPISLKVSEEIFEEEIFVSAEIYQNTLLASDVNIISPQHAQNINSEDLFVALSYFRMEHLDTKLTQVFIDNINMTQRADIRETNLTLEPSNILPGYHQIKVLLFDKDGNQYDPILWSFNIVGDIPIKTENTIKGKVWNDYISNEVDTTSSYTNNTNFNLDFTTDWLRIRSKIKKSSLENNLSQAKDRYSFDFTLDKLKIKYGDFYPNINNFIISGNRVRGVGFNYNTKFFQLDLVSGELARAVQGNPDTDAVVISDYGTEYICDETIDPACDDGYDSEFVDISRSGYTFKRDVSGLRLGFGNPDRMNFGFNILKVKDDINSVNKDVSNATVSLPYDLELFENFNSDQFIDVDENGEYTLGEELVIDYNDDEVFDNNFKDIDDIAVTGYDTTIPLSMDYIMIEGSTSYCSEYIDDDEDLGCVVDEETKPLIQWVWDIKVDVDDLENILNEEYLGDEDQINSLEDQWAGDRPEDNLVIGSDFSFKSKNKNLKFRTSIAMSLLNENIWNPVITMDDLDVLFDEFEDCYFGREYVLLDDVGNEINPGDLIWGECGELPIYNGEPIDLVVTGQGVALSDLPDLESLEDIFHFNSDAVPTVPFYSVIQTLSQEDSCSLGICQLDPIDLTPMTEEECELEGGEEWAAIDDKDECSVVGGEWIIVPSVQFSDFMNSPEVAYDMDFSFRAFNNQIQFGIKQVGQSFNTLGNPYLQKDMREKYISDRLRLLENRMFLTFKFSEITNGISDDNSPDMSNKFDVNISYYPSITLPSFNISSGSYKRRSGEPSAGYDNTLTYWDVDNQECIGDNTLDELECETDIAGVYDTRVNTETNNYNLSINHSFDYIYRHNATFTYYYSSKNDLLLHERGDSEEDYVSPRSRNRNLGINLKTTFDTQWESNFNYSNSSFDFAQPTSEYYEKQKINSLSMSFNYKMNDKIEKLGAGIDYVNGRGSTKYNQFSIRLYSEFLLLNNLDLNIRYNYRIKKITSSDDYYNSMFKVNLAYRF